MKSTLKIKFVVLLIFALQGSIVLAQPADPSTPPPEVPITGIEILIGAGILIGARKLKNFHKKR